MLRRQFEDFFRKEPLATLPLPTPASPSSGHSHSDTHDGPEGGQFEVMISI